MGIELNNEQILTVYKCENWFRHSSQQVFEIAGAAGTGKAQPVDTLIPTPDGEKRLGDLKVGDFVFNRYGKPVKVLGVFNRGELDTYKVTLFDGRSTLCNDEHLWTVFHNNNWKTLTVKEMLKIEDDEGEFQNFYVPANGIVEYNEKNISLNQAYNDGKSYYENTKILYYINTSIEQRICFLKGFIEKYGSITGMATDNPGITIQALNKPILQSLQKLMISMGWYAKISKYPSLCTKSIYTLEVEYVDKKILNFFRGNIQTIDTNILKTYSNRTIEIDSIDNLGYKSEMRCIYVDDPEHLYLTNDYIVTHNTTIVLYLIEQLGLKLHEVLFLAYQGKAACRLSMTGLPAKTIHSAIYHYEKELMKDSEGRYLRNEKGKIRTKGVFKKREFIGGDDGDKIKLIVVDEAGMVNKEIAEDLKSFKIPIIVLGDLNQLPPVFGKPYFLTDPDVVLTKIMRQNEGNPIVYLSQQILAGNNLNVGLYGKSEVIKKSDLIDTHFSKADIVLCETNRLRWNVNNFFREQLRQYKQLDYPHNGEKVICRKNNWSRCIDGGIYLTNGLSGYVDSIQRWSYNRKENTMVMDFRPDFTETIFKDVKFNYEFMFTAPRQTLEETENSKDAINDYFNDRFEFGYSITVHLSQGSQYNNVLYLNENIMRTKEDQRKLAYTAITRAIDRVTVVI